MDSASPANSPDKSDVKPSFRKPSNDASHRKYRRHSPDGGSDSSSSGGSTKRERSHSLIHSKEDRPRMSDDRARRDDGRELDRDSSRNRSSRADSHRHSDRHSYGDSRDFRRHDEYGRYNRYGDEDERNYHRSSRSGRDSRSERNDTRSDRTRRDSVSGRSRDNWHNADNHPRDKSENGEHRSKHNARDSAVQEHHKYDDKEYDRAAAGSRQYSLCKDYGKSEQDWHRGREGRDDRRDRHRSPGYYKNDHMSSHEESKDSTVGKDSVSFRVNETLKSGNMEIDGQEDQLKKRKHSDRESDKHKEKQIREAKEEVRIESRCVSDRWVREGKIEDLDKTSCLIDNQYASATKLRLGHSEGEKPSSSLKQASEISDKDASDSMGSTTNQAGAASDLNAAKVAAMKAAELVNRNLVGAGGVGYLSTDQKKKLLWGNKKNSSTEETANRWDLHLFSDRERQEKFNKLMGVKGNAAPECKSDGKDGNPQVKKQEELEMDLEKQYTAGLRRRDGRTVGLGL